MFDEDLVLETFLCSPWGLPTLLCRRLPISRVLLLSHCCGGPETEPLAHMHQGGGQATERTVGLW